MGLRHRLLVAGWFIAPLAFSISTAFSHPQFALSTINRYGKLVLGGPGLGAGPEAGAVRARLFFTFMVGDVPANTLRRQADRDGNGRLDSAEQQALAQRLLDLVTGRATGPATGGGGSGGVTVTLDEKPVAISWETPLLSLPDPRVGPLAFSCELSAPLRLELGQGQKGGHLLRYEDRADLEPVGDVELRIEEAPGVRVLAAWQGAEPAAADAHNLTFLNQGPPRSSLSDRSVSLRFAVQSLGGGLGLGERSFGLKKALAVFGLFVVGLLGLFAVFNKGARSRRAG